MSISSRYRDIVLLFPRFLSCRPFGWKGFQRFVQVSGLERPAIFLLRALVQETNAGEMLETSSSKSSQSWAIQGDQPTCQ